MRSPAACKEVAFASRWSVAILFLAGRRDPLDLDIRRQIFEQVGKYPGLHLREVARALDLHPNHAKYHLQRLEKSNLVSSKREDGYWRFWPREQGSIGYRDQLSRQDKNALAVLRRPVPLHVALLLLDRQEATHGELLEEVHVAHATLHYHLGKMQESGLLASRKEGRQRWYWLADAGHVTELLLRYRPPKALIRRFLDAWEQIEPASAQAAAKQGAGRVVVALRHVPSGRGAGSRAGSGDGPGGDGAKQDAQDRVPPPAPEEPSSGEADGSQGGPPEDPTHEGEGEGDGGGDADEEGEGPQDRTEATISAPSGRRTE